MARLQAAIDGYLVCYNYAAAVARVYVGLLLLFLVESAHLWCTLSLGLMGYAWTFFSGSYFLLVAVWYFQ